MKQIAIQTGMPKEKLLKLLRDNDFVNDGVKFDEKLGKPFMHVKDKGEGKIRITCELLERPTKDDSFFLLGTYFKGRITETEGGAVIKGHILTAPIYHLVWAALVIVFIIQCFRVGGFSVAPICLVVINLFMFSNEYKKQGLIERYIKRAIKRAHEEKY